MIQTRQDSEEGTAEAVAHSVGAQADVHAGVFFLGTGNEQLVEVGAVGPWPHLPGGQHYEVVLSNLDGWIVLALVARFHSLQPLDNRFNITTYFALEGRGAAVVYCSVHRMSSSQDGLRVGALWR